MGLAQSEPAWRTPGFVDFLERNHFLESELPSLLQLTSAGNRSVDRLRHEVRRLCP
jgi:hypothetical protein